MLLWCYQTNTHNSFSLQLETILSKKDAVLAAKDLRIAALEGRLSSGAVLAHSSTPVKGQTTQLYANQTPQVSDDSCDVESESSFSLSVTNSSSFESTDVVANDGRWNIPFDEDCCEDDLVPKSSSSEKTMPHENALKDIGFVSIGAHDAAGFSEMSEMSPVRSVAARGIPAYSPILHPAQRGPTNNAKVDKENVEPLTRALENTHLSRETSSSFSSPHR
jgi:hypothetical protein